MLSRRSPTVYSLSSISLLRFFFFLNENAITKTSEKPKDIYYLKGVRKGEKNNKKK